MADHYIRLGALGSNDGSDWTNAWTTLAAVTWTRGDTYYVADGDYEAGAPTTLDLVESGTQLVTIVKATLLVHGTETGWDSSYGNGVANFDDMLIKSGYWVFNGAASTMGSIGTYGFRITRVDPNDGGNQILFVGDSPGSTLVKGVTIKHVEVISPGSSFDTRQSGVFVGCGACETEDITIANCYFEDCQTAIDFSGGSASGGNLCTGCIVEYCYFENNWSSPAKHGETLNVVGGVLDLTIRYNILKNAAGTATVAWHGPGPTVALDGGKIYGNIVISAGGGNGVWASGGSNFVCANTLIYNNVHYNCGNKFFHPGDPAVAPAIKDLAVGNVAYNNLLVDGSGFISQPSPVTHDYNYYINCTSVTSETNGVEEGSGDPFVDAAAENFRLLAATAGGIVLGSPYNQDPDGVTRGADAVWDRGAFEFEGSVSGSRPGSGRGPHIGIGLL